MTHNTDQPAIGYKSPPQQKRFQKGRSGNPSGRKKSSPEGGQNDREVVLSGMRTITIDGKKVRVTARRALYYKLLSMSLGGDLRAMSLLLKADGLNDNSTGQADVLSAAATDAILADYVRRHGGSTGGDDA